MNQLHILLFQKHVQDEAALPTLLATDHTLALHIVHYASSLQERIEHYPIYGLLYECDVLGSEELNEVTQIQALKIPYLLLIRKKDPDVDISHMMDKVIIKPENLTSPTFVNKLLVMVKMMRDMSEEQKKPLHIKKLPSINVIAIGASTGGPRALVEVLKHLPDTICGIVIVQHMSEGNSYAFADYLDRQCDLNVQIAKENDLIQNGNVYISKQKEHFIMKRESDGFHLHYIQGERLHCVCPSIDILFESVATAAGSLAAGVLLTGMGSDGAVGLKKMKDAGAFTIIQDSSTSEIYSMPKVAKELHAHNRELALSDIGPCLIQHFTITGKRR